MTKIQLVAEDVDVDNFDDAELPSDVHLVTFIQDGVTHIHAVRAYTKVDIFDVYYDRVIDNGTVQSIESGFGRIRPNLYGKIKEQN